MKVGCTPAVLPDPVTSGLLVPLTVRLADAAPLEGRLLAGVPMVLRLPGGALAGDPAETHSVLRRRAAAAHQSLQEYLRTRLVEEASRPTLEEVLDRADRRAGGSLFLEVATAMLREDRDRR